MRTVSFCLLAAALALNGCDCGNGGTDGGNGGGGTGTGGGLATGGGSGGGAVGGSGGGAVGGGSGGGSTGGGTATGGGSATGGGGSATGGGSAVGGGSGGGSSVGGGSGTSCTADGGTCGTNQYCNIPGCTGSGTCAGILAVSQESASKAPVCGCDGNSYWNATVAQSHGESVSANGACSPGTTCGGFAGLQCSSGLSCDYGAEDSSVCNTSDVGGSCWGMPAQCAQVVVGTTSHACNGGCSDECALIKSGSLFYNDPTCPQ